MPAATTQNIQNSFANAARELGLLGPGKKTSDVKRLVRNHLSKSTSGQWLLIFDNADDIDIWIKKSSDWAFALREFFPESLHGSILFTARVHDAVIYPLFFFQQLGRPFCAECGCRWRFFCWLFVFQPIYPSFSFNSWDAPFSTQMGNAGVSSVLFICCSVSLSYVLYLEAPLATHADNAGVV